MLPTLQKRYNSVFLSALLCSACALWFEPLQSIGQGMANTLKISPELWIETAKKALIEEGLAGVKVDRLAKTLNVTRGGFYYHFKRHDELLDRLIEHWAETNDFLPQFGDVSSPLDAFGALDAMVRHLILESGFSASFEMAMREWARIDPTVHARVDKIDAVRIERIAALFKVLGYDADEAGARSRVLFFHQIGYYSLGYNKRQSPRERMKNAPIYMHILCGPLYETAGLAYASRRTDKEAVS
jgi:AcrR family transcriptional regulator